ncbi:MAG: ABC-type transport system involved in multi-copper enzyme maturation permease subunit [Pseudohongiellaceae bacterium]
MTGPKEAVMPHERRPAPPTGFTAVHIALATATAGALKGRRLLGMLALMGLPMVIVALRALLAEGGRGTGFASFAFVVIHIYGTLLLPMSLIWMGTGAFGDEWAGGTAHYVAGVPLPRWSLVFGRWLATVRRALCFVLPAIVVVFFLCVLPYEGGVQEYAGDLGWVLVVLTLMCMAYSALFVCLGLLLKRAVIMSLCYVFAVEAAISNLPQAFASLSMSFHGRNLLWQITGRDDFQPALMGDGGPFDAEPHSITVSVIAMLIMVAMTLIIATVALWKKECGGGAAGANEET